jgi:hypothetical protein
VILIGHQPWNKPLSEFIVGGGRWFRSVPPVSTQVNERDVHSGLDCVALPYIKFYGPAATLSGGI